MAIDCIPDYDDDDFECFFPLASKCLSKDMVRKTLKELKKKNEDSHLWVLNDYHYSLLYDLLRAFCGVQNDIAKESNEPILKIDGSKIYEIDFDEIVEHYFYDLDFLLPKKYS